MSSAAAADAARGDPVVYVLDDDPSVLRALDRLVRSVGLDVRTFPSAAAFLSGAAADRPCCLVVDVRMPGLSGFDLQETLSRAGWTAPFVFMSGYGTIPLSVRAMRRGAVNFLQKPVAEQELLDSIREALQRDDEARRERDHRAAITARLGRLTPREREVFLLVVSGLPNKRIAGRLGTSEKTIKVHRARVMTKMEATSLAELVRMATDVGLPPEDVPLRPRGLSPV